MIEVALDFTLHDDFFYWSLKGCLGRCLMPLGCFDFGGEMHFESLISLTFSDYLDFMRKAYWG
jgi:hypothetical protein